MNASFSVRHGQLRISREYPPREWCGLVDGLPVLDLLVTPTGKFAIVLLDPPAGRSVVQNLVCVTPDADIAWRAAPPLVGGADAYVSIEAADDGLIAASTWSGYRVLISPDNGHVIRQDFTK